MEEEKARVWADQSATVMGVESGFALEVETGLLGRAGPRVATCWSAEL